MDEKIPLMDANVWVVVAAFNESVVISDTLPKLQNVVPNIVVVDDCSSDDTAIKAMALNVHVLSHPINLGQGAALQTGVDFCIRAGADFVVTFDADGQHDANEVYPMLNALIASQSEIALGSRFIGKTVNLPRRRFWILKAAILYSRITTGIRLTDAHNGFRIMTKEFCSNFSFKQNRMAHASEILSHIAQNRIRYVEFPVTITYTGYSVQKGQKNGNALRVIMEILAGYIQK
jgi:polyprenyl-phospho-N-acetylgalactosaminyl synthase